MRQIFAGALLVVAGIAAFIEAHSHRPKPASWGEGTEGLSHTAYDLLRIGAWALVIFGALLVVTGLIRYWARRRGGDASPSCSQHAALYETCRAGK
jgi:uncharacterized membrane protein HdeD (DUF308 family)